MATQAGQRTRWMYEGSYGLMVHWLAPGPYPEKGERVTDLNRAVDNFNVDRLMDDVAACGAAWLIFTLGQNEGVYASPNATLDRLAGPGRSSRRDLALDIAQGLHRQGKRFVAYLPSEVKAQSEEIHRAFAWDPKDQTEFQRRYTGFVREYAERFGRFCDGWWFDGCYTWPDFHNSLYRWEWWASAARAGNPEAALAFNDGSFCVGLTKPLTPLQDYTSGETETLVEGMIQLGRDTAAPLYLPKARFVPGTPPCQWHALVPIDCAPEMIWGHYAGPGPIPPPRYSEEDLTAFVKRCRAVGGAVTLNVGIYQEGHLGRETLSLLRRMSASLNHRG